MRNIAYIFVLLILVSCKEEAPKKWSFSKEIQLDGINPLGIAIKNNELWLSDSDHNRLVQIDETGLVLNTVDSLDRPMHIDANSKDIFVPEYGLDRVSIIENGVKSILGVNDSLDAPAGFSTFENQRAIADFYNHRILFFDGSQWSSFGKEGKKEGEFYYPTDVQITKDKIWVADAYNNRVQVFDKSFNLIKIIGADKKMNAATGVYVSNKNLFVTDFENDRILAFDLEGNFKQAIIEKVLKPTDIILYNSQLLVLNYRNQSITVFDFK